VALVDDASAPGVLEWGDVLAAGGTVSDHLLRGRHDAVDPDDPVTIQYTSGTTGLPKGAELTHVNLVQTAWHVGERMRMTSRDRVCLPVPPYSALGGALGTLAALARGATVVLPADRFDAEKTLAAIALERCSVLHGVPSTFVAGLAHPRFAEFDLSSLRTGIIEGGSCSLEIMQQVVQRMHCREITVAYGQAETTSVVTQTRAEDPLELRVWTVGRALPGVEVKIADTGTGREVPRGAQGELWCRGYPVMRGYYGMPEATARVLDRDAWLHTGDVATMDEHGYCRIVGRLADRITPPVSRSLAGTGPR
jgi:fatty-acyl-CoA synthase